jgi:uncharacterized protein with PIN domain
VSKRKYEFTGHTIKRDNKVLKQIKRISDGLIGGYIESEANLSHEGDCFVYGNARVFGQALVFGNARVSENARVYGQALVFENARVSGRALVYGDARVYGQALVFGNALVYGDAQVYGDAWVSENAWVYGQALVFENARVSGRALVYGDAQVSGRALVSVGTLNKTPIHISGLKHPITISDTHIYIGCEAHDIEYWRRNIRKIGLKHGYSEKEIRQVILILKSALKGAKL